NGHRDRGTDDGRGRCAGDGGAGGGIVINYSPNVTVTGGDPERGAEGADARSRRAAQYHRRRTSKTLANGVLKSILMRWGKRILAVVSLTLALAPAAALAQSAVPNYQVIPNYSGIGSGQQFRNDLNNHLSGVTPIAPR